MSAARIYPLNIRFPQDLCAAMERIGADPRAGAYFQPKRRTRHIFVEQADFRAAAYMKQELLARGGDAVVGMHVIDAKTDTSDVLLVATDGELNALLKKMEAMDCWGLKALREGLRSALDNAGKDAWVLPLPGGRELRLDARTKVMGILNLTDDSFHASSRAAGLDDILERAGAMLADGTDMVDIGAESTRPGSTPVSEEEELKRLIPAIKALRNSFPDAVISADTYKGKVALAAAEAGADIINDISGFALDSDMLKSAAQSGLPYVLSHIKGTPRDMQRSPAYENLLGELNAYFQMKIEEAEQAGLQKERIVIDPGLGFGKRTEDNLLIHKEVESLSVFGRPILLGYSRKKFTGTVTGTGRTDERLAGTLAVSALMEGRAQVVRVHDVKENKNALLMAGAIKAVF
ncbi:MAG: dihydropteroate synthase [Synergistaceae bacterium]|nr:dihydropteroate synthase [Synergistaceae bacterium]